MIKMRKDLSPQSMRNILRSGIQTTIPRAIKYTGSTSDCLRDLVLPTSRGLKTSKEAKDSILACVDELAVAGSGSLYTSSTWRLLWTTEKETLFILERAGLFGTSAGDVYQVMIMYMVSKASISS